MTSPIVSLRTWHVDTAVVALGVHAVFVDRFEFVSKARNR